MRLFLLIILSSCTSVFYQPTRITYATPNQVGVVYEDVFFDSGDGTRLHGWYLQHKSTQPAAGLVTFFHGNAQNISSHFLNLAWLTEFGYDVFIFDYRGYGLSVGKPTPKKINLDALAALKKSRQFLQEKKIKRWIVHAQSLGGMIAMRALEDFKFTQQIDQLVLDSTFDSYDDVAFDKLTSHWLTFLFSPLGPLLVSDCYAPSDFFKNYAGKVLVMHGKQDVVIPIKFGHSVYERLERAKKEWWSLEHSQHIDAFHQKDAKAIREAYLEKIKAQSPRV